jgi:hypothetical protein
MSFEQGKGPIHLVIETGTVNLTTKCACHKGKENKRCRRSILFVAAGGLRYKQNNLMLINQQQFFGMDVA